MATFSFLTIQHPAEGIYKERGSKFISFALHVTSEEEVKTNLASLRKKFFDARHHCYAYVLGSEKTKFKSHDDGEPNHSAGDPILGQIRAKNLTDVLVVVVRYFGGVKLGVGGLMQAYKIAADDALRQATIIEVEVTKEITIVFEYPKTPEVMKLIKAMDMKIIDQTFESSCLVRARLKLRMEENLRAQLAFLASTGVEITGL